MAKLQHVEKMWLLTWMGVTQNLIKLKWSYSLEGQVTHIKDKIWEDRLRYSEHVFLELYMHRIVDVKLW